MNTQLHEDLEGPFTAVTAAAGVISVRVVIRVPVIRAFGSGGHHHQHTAWKHQSEICMSEEKKHNAPIKSW